ncbi:cation:proton antiporter [Saccharicrinis aurantiacus]|uniref:cation:proton antiporter n=1 Tax=Saccharicrinis aurantiacus TaxID=1849719 RepID=UPI0024924ACD|nr:cation:proton antiporter [Saccharicrinis aurantiacus]
MNVLLDIGVLLILGYTAGWMLNKIGLPKIVGYILVGVALSPNTSHLIGQDTIETTKPLMDICLAFIAFEVGGALKWSKIKIHEKEIVNITVLASIIPFILIALTVFIFGVIFPSLLPFGSIGNLSLALLLGVLASPTAPAATLAVIHQYKAKGKVTDTILGVVALDDAVGIILFSIVISILSMFLGDHKMVENAHLNAVYRISMAMFLGAGIALLMNLLSKMLQIKTEGQWIVIITSMLILCLGTSKLLQVDELLANMTLGLMIANRSNQHTKIFKVVERYTEELIFLIFFLLSGLHLDFTTIPQSIFLISIFVGLRIVGKYIGVNIGARAAKADTSIRKYTAGGLLPQAGVVIGLVLSISQNEIFSDISEVLLTTIIGATIINELIGPIITKLTLKKAGEIKNE